MRFNREDFVNSFKKDYSDLTVNLKEVSLNESNGTFELMIVVEFKDEVGNEITAAQSFVDIDNIHNIIHPDSWFNAYNLTKRITGNENLGSDRVGLDRYTHDYNEIE